MIGQESSAKVAGSSARGPNDPMVALSSEAMLAVLP
jgi:hypothetical protein